MRVIIIGAVAAGTSAATEIRRNDKEAEIKDGSIVLENKRAVFCFRKVLSNRPHNV